VGGVFVGFCCHASFCGNPPPGIGVDAAALDQDWLLDLVEGHVDQEMYSL